MSTAVIEVPFEIVQKWQEIVNVIAEIIHVPSALVMKVESPNIKVFVSSESSGNPYERDELAPLNTGLYCETVMKTRLPLLVPDAVRDEEWKSNPDIKLGMISYLGFPVTWPDGQIFGTICVLDKKENSYSELYRKFVMQCRDVLQADLRALARLSGELTRSEAYLEEAQRLSHTGSFGWRVFTGEIVWSKESFRIFGYDQSLAVTLDMVLQRVHPEDRALVQTTLDRASRDGKDFDYECRLLTAGSTKYVHVVAHAVGDQADQLEFIGAVMDVTEAKRVEEQMHQARADLAHVARVMTIGELTAAIAHEINQPLAALVTQGNACLRWLAHEPPNLQEGRSSAEAMIDSGLRAAEVISRLRAMMKKSPPHRDMLNINDAILAVTALVGTEAQRNRVSLRTELSNDLPLVLGDRIQLQQVILNLIMNAIEAVRGIDQTQRKVLVVSRKDDESKGVLVEVQDSGAGLEGLALDRLFDAFYTTKPDGMGIGLAVSRTIIELHGGQLRALSNVPKGAVFQFQLPTNGEVIEEPV